MVESVPEVFLSEGFEAYRVPIHCVAVLELRDLRYWKWRKK